MEIIYSENPKHVAAQKLTNVLKAHSDTPVLLLLSGGSWFEVLDLVDATVLGTHCTIGMLDERYSIDPQVNNFTQLTAQNFYTRARAHGCAFIATNVTAGDSPTSLRQRWESNLKKWRTENQSGTVIATVGIGKDGHIAGLFPGVLSPVRSASVWTQIYDLPPTINQYRERITVTEYFLKHIVQATIVYAVGAEKKAIIAKISQEEVGGQTVPASILQQMKTVVCVTDV